MKQISLKVTNRTEKGRGPAGRLRRNGQIPAVLYGKSGNHSLAIQRADFLKLWQQMSGATVLIEIHREEEKPVFTIIQEVQRHPLTDHFLHIDFREIETDKPMTTDVIVHVTGEAVGVKRDGGLLEVHAHEVEVRCLPRHLPEHIEVDVSDLLVGQSIHVRDLGELEGVKFLSAPETVIVTCVGKTEEEEKPEEEAPEEAEGEAPAGEEKKTAEAEESS